MKMIRQYNYKKQYKGFTIIEVLFASVLVLLITISSYKVISSQYQKNILDEIAYSTAQRMYTLSQPALKYIEDHIDSDLPDSFSLKTLKEEGYVESNVSSKLDMTPLGRGLVFYVNNDNGFPLSISLYMTGELSKKILERNGLNDNLSMLSFSRKVAFYLDNLFETKYTVGVINSDYQISLIRSNTEFDLSPYIKKGNTNVSNQYSTALFINLQENPGYWVFNYNSTSYTSEKEAEGKEDISNYLYSMGYSIFCPNPSIVPSGTLNDSTVTGISTNSVNRVGNKSNNYYICIPSSEVEVKKGIEEYSIDVYYVENIERVEGGACRIRNAFNSILEFKLGERYFTFIESAGRVYLSCSRPYNPVYSVGVLKEGKFSNNKQDVKFSFGNYYSPELKDIPITKINLSK